MKRYTLALDLKDDPELIHQYEIWHREGNGWPEVRKSILDAGIVTMEIYRTGNRLFMIMDAKDDFSFEEKATMDAANSKVQEWETLMSTFQQPVPWAKEGEKWVMMTPLFALHATNC